MKKIFPLLLFLSSLSFANEDYVLMDTMAIEAGTDKSSHFHNYTEVYARYFANQRQDSLKFLEIGILKGDSVKFWENYFPFADLHFIDNNHSKIAHFSDRSSYHLADQANKKQLTALMHKIGGNFDIIIDDGGHRMEQQIRSFEALFPHLRSGGIYVIEDLHTSYWESYGAKGPNTCVHFLKNRIDDLNYTGAKTGCAGKIDEKLKAELSLYQDQIFSIHFYKSLCLILKK